MNVTGRAISERGPTASSTPDASASVLRNCLASSLNGWRCWCCSCCCSHTQTVRQAPEESEAAEAKNRWGGAFFVFLKEMHKLQKLNQKKKKRPVDLLPLAARHCWRLRLEASTFRLPVPISIKHFLAAISSTFYDPKANPKSNFFLSI